MAHPSKVSVIIPSFNGHQVIGDALRSLRETGYPALEILIVDDGSREETLDALRRLEGEYPATVRVLRHPDGGNHGQGASRNLGIREASGDYVCFLDQDDCVLPHRFTAAVAILDANPTVDGVYERTTTQILEGGESRIGRVRTEFIFECDDPDRVLEKIVTEGKVWHTPAILLRRAKVVPTGGFSEVNRFCEDLVLWLKLAGTTRLVRGSDNPVAVYRVHAHNISTKKSRDETLVGTYLAYLEAYAWYRRQRAPAEKLGLLRRSVRGQLYYACSLFRSEANPRRAIDLLLRSGSLDPPVLVTRKFWANLIRSLYEAGMRGGGSPAGT